MRKDNLLWKLDGVKEIGSQYEFYKYLKKSDHLKDLIYSPEELKQEDIGQTTRIEKKKFERVSFTRTHISGIIFRDCTFHQCLFIDTTISNCEFHSCRFISTNTHKVSISQTYIDPLNFKDCLDEKQHQNVGVYLYHMLLKNSRDEDQIEFERDARFLFLRWKRLQVGYELSRSWNSWSLINQTISKSVSYSLRWFWEKLFGSGVKLRCFFYTTLGVIFLFSVLNYFFREEFGIVRDEIPITNLIEAFYFTTVTLTTLGYGDLVPTTSCGRLFAAFQSVIGFCLFAVLASMLFRRVSP